MDDRIRLLVEHLSADASTVEPILGATHHVFRFRVGAERRVLKAYLRPEAAGTELRILRLLNDADFPAPRVLDADATGQLAGIPFLLQEDLGAETVASRMSRGADGAELTQRMGELLALAHTIHFTAPGVIRGDRVEPFDQRALAKTIHDAAIALERRRLISAAVRDAVLAIERLPLEGLSLCHTDFHPVQCVADGPRVKAVVDWEGAWSANPVIDVAIAHAYLRFYGVRHATEAFLAGYATGQGGPIAAGPEYASVQALHLTALAARWSDAGKRRAAERAGQLLRECVAETR